MGLGDVDLKQQMEQAAAAEKSSEVTTVMTTVMTAMPVASSSHVVEAEVYAKPYAKMTKSRGERSTARSERREAKEKEEMIQKQKEEEDCLAKEEEAMEQVKVVEHALLEEEEKSQEEVLRKMREKEEKRKRKEKEAKDKDAKAAEKEARKRKYIEEEEERYVNDEDQDPDFDPNKEFIEPDDIVIEDEDEEHTFQIHKHSHALNFSEAGEFVVWVRGQLEELQRAVRRGKNMDTHYKTFVTILKDAVMNMGSWGPIAGADVDAVVKTVVNMNCTAWKKAMQGVKTGNSKTIMKIEEKREGVIRVTEDKDIPMEECPPPMPTPTPTCLKEFTHFGNSFWPQYIMYIIWYKCHRVILQWQTSKIWLHQLGITTPGVCQLGFSFYFYFSLCPSLPWLRHPTPQK